MRKYTQQELWVRQIMRNQKLDPDCYDVFIYEETSHCGHSPYYYAFKIDENEFPIYNGFYIPKRCELEDGLKMAYKNIESWAKEEYEQQLILSLAGIERNNQK